MVLLDPEKCEKNQVIYLETASIWLNGDDVYIIDVKVFVPLHMVIW